MSAALHTASKNSVTEFIAADMQAVNNVIRARLHSEVPLVNQVAEYIIGAGGKRIRPALVLLIANAHGYRGQAHHELAAVIEFIHTATLLHDDFLYSRSFQMMVSVGNARVMQILADATNVIAEGEVLQLLNMHNPEVNEAAYLQVIRSKTARLFEAAAEVGALISGASDADLAAAGEYGGSLGTAFQLIDDVLDYSGNAAEIGKNVGDDLREGKPTLPLIYVMENGTAQQRDLVRSCIENGDEQHFDQILSAITGSGALDYTRAQAEKAAQRAGSFMPMDVSQL